ncbi:MOSC domain-containing protein [Falsiroseomonas tokyonensis]|uniref:MOSC domain-containing protein n=1 Tax=Falsiroseomonas tokyonensis TaxID=430521 RepID=A0ABV7C3Z3_9PROT|nr:MOSC N-terminal beta barrel domain-containing protein [Falsiroseomonas tokyonensis]MBU8541350.1 MOSC domain-containing protein [Falsiroseomonas tokyonensis]
MSSVVGKVVGLARFPVKSMAGEAMPAMELQWRGLAGDREYGFVQQGHHGHFPWLTGRELSGMVRYQPRYLQPEDPRRSPVAVVAPDGAVFDLKDAALADRLSTESGKPSALLHVGRGVFDSMPVSVITTRSLALLETLHGAALDARRFRINILVESEAPDAEWAGRVLEFGDGAQLLLAEGAPRCAMVTICPETAARDPRVLRSVAQHFDNRLGMYAAPARLGMIRLGDTVRLFD